MLSHQMNDRLVNYAQCSACCVTLVLPAGATHPCMYIMDARNASIDCSAFPGKLPPAICPIYSRHYIVSFFVPSIPQRLFVCGSRKW